MASKSKAELQELTKAFNNDKDLVLFFAEWLKNGKNATKAYQKLHPGVDYGSAATLGSRMLKKVDVTLLLETYGLGIDSYLTQLKEGLEANRSDMTGQILPDHKTRKAYHETLGKLLGIEKNESLLDGDFAFVWRAKGGEKNE